MLTNNDTRQDIIRTVQAARRQKQSEIVISHLCAKIEIAIENLRKFATTGQKEYYNTAINILESLRK